MPLLFVICCYCYFDLYHFILPATDPHNKGGVGERRTATFSYGIHLIANKFAHSNCPHFGQCSENILAQVDSSLHLNHLYFHLRFARIPTTLQLPRPIFLEPCLLQAVQRKHGRNFLIACSETPLRLPRKIRFHKVASLMSSVYLHLFDARALSVQSSLRHFNLVSTLRALLSPGHCVYCLISPLWNKVYVGATGFGRPRSILDRWWEHIRCCRLWQSYSSQCRYMHRVPPLYQAMGSIGLHNVVVVLLRNLNQGGNVLAHSERWLIRLLAPTFNAIGNDELSHHPVPVHSLNSWWSDDVVAVASRLLRKANPRLSDQQWVALVSYLREAGKRSLASKVARLARSLRPKLRTLRSNPQLSFPCPVPPSLLKTCQSAIRRVLRQLPSALRRTPFP